MLDALPPAGFSHRYKKITSKDTYRAHYKDLLNRGLRTPSAPERTYKDQWISWKDFSGVKTIRSSKFTKQDLLKIVMLKEQGQSNAQIAQIMKVSNTTIDLIVRGDRFSDITGIKK